MAKCILINKNVCGDSLYTSNISMGIICEFLVLSLVCIVDNTLQEAIIDLLLGFKI